MARRKPDPESAAGQTVQRILNETKTGLDAHATRCRRFDRAYEVWRAPDNDQERRGRPSWKPLLKVKYGMQVVDQTTVAISQGIPAVRCTPRSPDSVGKAKAMEQLLSYYTDLAHLAEREAIVSQQALVYSVSPAKTMWLYKEADRTQLVPAVDYDGTVLWQPGVKRIVEDDRPEMCPLDAYDVWWDPAASSPDDASYVICRYWLSKDDLLERGYNEDTGAGQYRNLELLFNSGPGAERPSTKQNELLGADSPSVYRNRFEIWEVWRDDSLTVIGNRQVLLADGPKPYWMKGKPVTISNSRPDFFRIEGVSETELIDHIQQNLHATDNLRLENWRFSVQRGATVRETVPDMKALVVQPHFLWPVQDHDDVRFVDQPQLPPEAYQEHQVLLSLMQYITGVNDIVAGTNVGSATNDTATGANILANAASKLLAFKAEQIARHTWQRTYEQWAALTRQFLRSDVDVAVRGPGETIDWVRMGPQDVYGDYDVRVQYAEESVKKQQRRADLITLTNALAPFAQAGLVDIKPVLREVADAFEFPSAESLFPAPHPQPPAAPAQLTLNGAGPQFPAGPTPNTLAGRLAPLPLGSAMQGNGGGQAR